MTLFRTRPHTENYSRANQAKQRRRVASEVSSNYAAEPTRSNLDESNYGGEERFPTSFTKGLLHDDFGQLETEQNYIDFVNEINKQDAGSFDNVGRGIVDASSVKTQRTAGDTKWRGWESPRAGHYYDLQGPDSDAVSMPPAPELGSEELIAEMAEVYALALLRDVPFSKISDLSGEDEQTEITVSDVLTKMSKLSWFRDTDGSGLSLQERRRRAARRVDPNPGYSIDSPPDNNYFDPANAFRGSAPASKAGPYVSQFMLLGNNIPNDVSGNVDESFIGFGRQPIDQKITSFGKHKDFMLHWNAYLDVQNGADFGDDTDSTVEDQSRFITTPRDLAAYVRYDALYQAYLNACLYMLGKTEFSPQLPVEHRYSGDEGPGFPDPVKESGDGTRNSRQAFAMFGGPHVLSLVTEVATRCLKAVRRQKFNYHRRARPERIGALLTLKGTEGVTGEGNDVSAALGSQTSAQLANMMLKANLGEILSLIHEHNVCRKDNEVADSHLDITPESDAPWFAAANNYLLPMAFAEGSPMHPSYGAGHATVAGGCVTMLKAFFNTTTEDGESLPWPDSLPVMQATIDGQQLESVTDTNGMTINGELNKLAANISIGRNMAGVHYYTDYYESLRMGERVAMGILIEQIMGYNEPCEFSFESFDGDFVHILKNDYDYAEPRIIIKNAEGTDVEFQAWWNRHVRVDDSETAVKFASTGGKSDVAKTSQDTATT